MNIWNYKDLKKPNFRPPNWVFPIVWPTLYSSMGVASYFIYKEGGGFEGAAKLPLTLYAVNLALNGSWTPLFFRFHKLGAAFYLSLLINASTLSCILSFWPVSRESAYLMIPYFLWGAFAS
ncbi:translocator protein-like isoform X3, partial [Dinothrombium tinctorium]